MGLMKLFSHLDPADLYRVPKDTINEVCNSTVYFEARHSENYLKIYELAKKTGQKNLSEQAKGFMAQSLKNLEEFSILYSSSTVEKKYKNKLTKHIKKLREILED